MFIGLLSSSVCDMRQPNHLAHGKLYPVLSTQPGIFRRVLYALAKILSGRHPEDQAGAGSPRRCLGPPAEGPEEIYWPQDLNHTQVARGAFVVPGFLMHRSHFSLQMSGSQPMKEHVVKSVGSKPKPHEIQSFLTSTPNN